MNFLILATLLALDAGGTQPAVAAGDNTAESAVVFKTFLEDWNGKEHHPINVSKVAELPNPDDIKDFTECAKADRAGSIDWEKSTSIGDLSGTLGHLKYVTFIDPKAWHPKDPGDLISKGQSVESAVDAGIDSGLLYLSAITFDKAHTTAAFTYSFVCGRLCGNGGAVIFVKTGAGWVRSKASCGNWISESSNRRVRSG